MVIESVRAVRFVFAKHQYTTEILAIFKQTVPVLIQIEEVLFCLRCGVFVKILVLLTIFGRRYFFFLLPWS